MNQDTPLKVAHFAVFSPGRSGQYGTVRDLILAERSIGIDAQFIDSETCLSCKGNKGKSGRVDGSITTVDEAWAWDADVLVRHSIIPEDLENSGIPIVICLHGRPENSFLLDQYGKVKVFHFLHQLNSDPRYHAAVTFWREYQFHFKTILPDRQVEFVPAMVNLDEFSPEGKKHDFGKKSGSPNIIIADIWREDVTPFNLVFAALKFQEKYAPNAKLHIFGLPGERSSPVTILVNRLINTPIAGDFYALSPDMMDKYRAADFLITPHNMATRVVRESLACGCPIVGGTGNQYTPFTADPRDIDQYAAAMNKCWEQIKEDRAESRKAVRQLAENEFSAESAGIAMKSVIQSVMKSKQDELDKIEIENKKITFAIAAYNSDYIEQVNVSLQSISQVYGDGANIIFYYSNIDIELIDEINRILPNVILKESNKMDCEDGDDEYKTAMKSIVWAEILEDHPELENVVFMDADMLLLKPLGKFFTGKFDVGYCYKTSGDENPNWPINAGVMLIKNSPRTVAFLKRWAELTIETQQNKLTQKDGYNQWGGGDQVSLGLILATRKQVDYQSPMGRLDIIMQGFPMGFFNESRCLEPGAQTHMIHYKSKSWQNLLKTGVFTPRRPRVVCQTLYDLYQKTLRAWQQRRLKITKAWAPDFELAYWTAHDKQFYLDDVQKLHEGFEVDKVIAHHFKEREVGAVIDVGGGAFGGELHFYSGGTKRVLYDYLADEYEQMNTVPDGIRCVKGDFSLMPFLDNSFDVIFAWEVLDHALSVGHFKRGQAELMRILKPNGLMFFNHPLFSRPKPGHTTILSKEEVFKGFKKLHCMAATLITEGTKADLGEIAAVFTKIKYSPISFEGLKQTPVSKDHPIELTMQNTTDGEFTLRVNELREVTITSLKIQNNPDRAKLYATVHSGPPETLFDIDVSPHVEFLKKNVGMDARTRYYLMHKAYGKSDGQALELCRRFTHTADDIKKNGLKLPPLVYDKGNGEYEIIDGHHRVAAHAVLGNNIIGVLVCEKK